MRILSLGWGVQSFTLLAMASTGDIEPVDYAIHSDTGFERSATYELEKKWIPYFEDKGIKIITTEELKAREKFTNSKQVFIPAFTSNGGMLMRTCTQRWKIAPIRRVIQKVRQGNQVDLLMGITVDEWQRMKPSGVKYITNVFPFIDQNLSRQDCIDWLKAHKFDIPVKSSCVFCPYHSLEAWKEVKKSSDWKKAVEVDESIRNRMAGCQLYVNSNKVPLSEFPDQPALFDYENDECSGYCFI